MVENATFARGSTTWPMLIVFALVVLFSLAVPSHAQSGLVTFNPPPVLPYEATTLEQDEFFKVANSLAGDGIEAAQLQACEDLIDSPNVPFELQRWAYLRRVTLYSYTYREHRAVEILEQWLEAYPDDPNAMGIRITKATIIGDRGHPDFRPTSRQKEEAYDEIFDNHSTNDIELVNARMKFVVMLQGYQSASDDGRISNRISEQLDKAEASLLRIHSRAVKRSETKLADYANRRLNTVRMVRDGRFDPSLVPQEALDQAQRAEEDQLRHHIQKMLESGGGIWLGDYDRRTLDGQTN